MRQFRSDTRKKRFLEHLAETGNVTAAALYAGSTREWAYKTRKKDEKFRQAWDDAEQQACDGLEAEARRRAVKGTKKFVWYKGKPVGKIVEYSDILLMCLLRAHRPELFNRSPGDQTAGPDHPDMAPYIDALNGVVADVWSDDDASE